jgi:hypothetical protein
MWCVIIWPAYARVILFLFVCRNSWLQVHYTQIDLHVAGIVCPFWHCALGCSRQRTWCQDAASWCITWKWPHFLPHSC